MMNSSVINKITIAIDMLQFSIPDRYGNGRVTHHDRNFVTATVAELLAELLVEIETEKSISIIPKNTTTINPPEEL